MASELSHPVAARPPGAATAPTVLIGFMGAGKTTAVRAIGDGALDVDEVIEARLGRSIEEIFAREGEVWFREVEERVTLELLDGAHVPVLALGGGAVLSALVRSELAHRRVVWLDVEVDEAWLRVDRGERRRPLAADMRAFYERHEERAPIYEALADVIVPASRSRALGAVLAALEGLPPEGTRMLWATSASRDYPVYIGDGLLAEQRFWPSTVSGRRVLVTDANVGRLYAQALAPVHAQVTIPAGEAAKTIASAETVWTELARQGTTRSDVLVALGGGVVGDVTGFCAATYQRGISYVQLPTTLVAQVDSAYGGKTGVDLPLAKNYVGAFHQPSAVITDPGALRSLPAPELAAGYAEALKTALIVGGQLWDRLRAGVPASDPEVIAACVLAKLRIVAQDEHDHGLRQLLNLGHTVGHAIETATGYARYRHGEAVGLGLLAELRLSGADELRAEVREMLLAAGLPVALEGADLEAIVAAAGRDKKRLTDGPVPFVGCSRPGHPNLGASARAADLRSVVAELSS